MKNIKIINLDKYSNKNDFEFIGDGVYKNLKDGNFRIAFSCELEDDENTQYPLEDILDKYYVNATDYVETKVENGITTINIELEGSLDNDDENYSNIVEISKMVGKRVYNKKNEKGHIELLIK